MKRAQTPLGTTRSGERATCFRLENASGASVELLDYGAALRSVRVPDRAGRLVEVCQGFPTLTGYEESTCYVGAVIGRCAGRIGGGRFSLGGRDYRLSVNQPPNHLHGGARGFDRYVWDAALVPDGICFSRISPDGEEGYPGSLQVSAAYTWTEDCVLRLDLTARSDRDTLVSLTHHGYWNLSGADGRSAGGLLFQTPSDRFTEIDGNGLPTGALLDVAGTPFDFRRPRAVGERWNTPCPQIKAAGGYDHTFLPKGSGLRPAATLSSPDTGITLTVDATLPGLHLYSGNFLEPTPRSAVALEAQLLPDAVHHPDFPSALLPAGGLWRHTIVYGFSLGGR